MTFWWKLVFLVQETLLKSLPSRSRRSPEKLRRRSSNLYKRSLLSITSWSRSHWSPNQKVQFPALLHRPNLRRYWSSRKKTSWAKSIASQFSKTASTRRSIRKSLRNFSAFVQLYRTSWQIQLCWLRCHLRSLWIRTLLCTIVGTKQPRGSSIASGGAPLLQSFTTPLTQIGSESLTTSRSLRTQSIWEPSSSDWTTISISQWRKLLKT